MDIIKGILGEAEEPEKKKKEKPEKAHKPEPKPEPQAPKSGSEHVGAPEDSEVDELANLWVTGNKNEVANRFMGMDNETAVKVVFAIGRDGALELARMVDVMLEQTGTEEEDQAGDSTEPAKVTPPPDTDYPKQILGEPHRPTRQDLEVFRHDRSTSPAGDAVRQHLGMS